MKLLKIKSVILLIFVMTSYHSNSQDKMKFKELTPAEESVILHKGTERPYTRKYYENKEKGTYTCKQCGSALYQSSDKFDSGCGWPSFDDEIDGAVKHIPDADGMRTEIVCTNCGGHLGHVFLGEGFTPKNTRHCVNSISMDFIPAAQEQKPGRALFASGCFWGTEYYFNKAKGVLSTTVGYTGGQVKNPTYEQVCTGKTGHAETVEVIFDPQQTDYETLARLFFETHDFTQVGGQGPDIGNQYRSVIFYTDDQQKEIAEKLVKILEDKGYKVATKLEKDSEFYNAEKYHQDYYQKTGGTPYCHIKRDVF
nr:bifunctional methionine sulfoxide reductase B/A protein [Bacteroidota bacterium]